MSVAFANLAAHRNTLTYGGIVTAPTPTDSYPDPSGSPTALPDNGVGRSVGAEFGGQSFKGVRVPELKVGTKLEFAMVRGASTDKGFDVWFKAPTAKNGTVTVFDFEGSAVKRYKITAAKPKTLEMNSVVGNPPLVTETLVLTYEKCEVV
jgi:hypothetical protein